MSMRLAEFVSPNSKVRIKKVLFLLKRIIHKRKKIITKYQYKEFYSVGVDTFFGYYDISPFNGNNDLIYLKLSNEKDTIKIVKNNVENNNEVIIAESHAWNWQQGCRLRWLTDSIISFNDFNGRSYLNRIINIETSEEIICPQPLYDIHWEKKLGVTLDFELLGKLRPGYGYTCKGDPVVSDSFNSPAIVLINIENGKELDCITYKDISNSFHTVAPLNSFYINHLSFSPEGNRFLFFWIEIVDGYHKASLAVYDIEKRIIIPLEDEGKASHYVWINNNNILCTVYSTPVDCRYYIYNVDKRGRTEYCPTSLTQDGHPSIYDKTHILTDTYPDANGYQYLRIVDSETDNYNNLVEIYSVPVNSGEKRTDLHPRFNEDKNMISFDANVRGRRSLFVIKM